MGKSTLLRLIAGLEKWDHGNVTCPPRLKNSVFFVAQDLELPPVRLLEKLLSQSSSVAVSEFARAARVTQIIAKEGMSGGFLDTAELLHKWVVLVSHDVLSKELEQRFNVVEMDHA